MAVGSPRLSGPFAHGEGQNSCATAAVTLMCELLPTRNVSRGERQRGGCPMIRFEVFKPCDGRPVFVTRHAWLARLVAAWLSWKAACPVALDYSRAEEGWIL